MSATTSMPKTPTRSARRIRTVLLVSAVLIAATDLAIKALVEALLFRGNVVDLGLMNIRLLYNSGVAFSLGTNLLLGGALGNFIDRLDGRGVVDYLHTGWFPTFNLADVFITAGVALFILGTLLSPRTQTRR